MAIKLKSLLAAPALASVLKALLFAVSLGLAAGSGLSFLWTAVFLILAAALYFLPFTQAGRYFYACAVLAAVALTLVYLFQGESAGIFFILASAGLFYLLLGLKNFFIVRRETGNYFLYLGLCYLLVFAFFASDRSANFLWQTFFAVSALFLLFREFLRIVEEYNVSGGDAVHANNKINLGAAIAALMSVELLWVIGLLPFGAVTAANLAFVSIFVITDLLRQFFKNTLSRQSILADSAIFIALTILIFASSRWSIQGLISNSQFPISNQ